MATKVNRLPSLRAWLHYLATLIFIGIYGIQVCPFIEGLTLFQLVTPLILIIGAQYLIHRLFNLHIIQGTPFKKQVARTFQIEWGVFFLSGLILTISNSLVYDFPLESGLKMILGFSAIGFFAAIDLSLERERILADTFRKQNMTLLPDSNYFPLVGKFSLFAILSVLLLIGIFFLVVTKDLDWLSKV